MGHDIVIRIRGPDSLKIGWDKLVAQYQEKMGKPTMSYNDVMEEILREKGVLPESHAQIRGQVFS